MKDRVLGMSLSYDKVGDSILDPLVREEVFFQGDHLMNGYADVDTMPFHIASVSGFEAVRSVTENASPTRVQNRELTVYLRVRDRSVDVHSILGRYMDTMSTASYSLQVPQGPFYVPRIGDGAGMVTLSLLVGNSSIYSIKRYECRVSIKSITGDLFAPSNNLYVLTMVMHDASFLRYESPYTVEWDLPLVGSFINSSGGALNVFEPITRLPSGITLNRLSRPRVTLEAKAVATTRKVKQYVQAFGYYSNPQETNTLSTVYNNVFTTSVTARQVVSPTDELLNVGDTATLVVNDPFQPGDIYRAPRRPYNSSEDYYFDGTGYVMNNARRGFEYMNFPISDGATVQIQTIGAIASSESKPMGADIKLKFEFFDILSGVVM